MKPSPLAQPLLPGEGKWRTAALTSQSGSGELANPVCSEVARSASRTNRPYQGPGTETGGQAARAPGQEQLPTGPSAQKAIAQAKEAP